MSCSHASELVVPLSPDNRQCSTAIHARKGQALTTCADSQVCVGERGMIKDNNSLGQVHLDRIPPAPRGAPRLVVSKAFAVLKSGAKRALAV